MTGLAISSSVRSTFACYPGPAHSDRSLRSKGTASYPLTGPADLRVDPDKLTPVGLDPRIGWTDRFRRYLALVRVSAKDRKAFVISAVRAVVAKGSFG